MASSHDAANPVRQPAPASAAGARGHARGEVTGAIGLASVLAPVVVRRAAEGHLPPSGSSLGPLAILCLQGTNGNAHVQRVLLQRQPQTLDAAKADAAAADKTVAALQKLAAAQDRVQLSLGKSRGGQDVTAFFFKGASSEVALVIAGVHGSELSGVEVAQTFIRLLSAKDAPKPYFSVVIVPQLFPDNVDAKRVWEKSQAKAGEQVAQDEYRKARRKAGDPGRYSEHAHRGADGKKLDPNRQFPELGKPFDPQNPVDANGLPIERENVMLLTLIDRFKPTRIAALHAIKTPKDAGIYADPHPTLPGLPAARKGLAQQAHELAEQMAEVAKKKGAKVPGNWREGPFSSLYPIQDPKINAEKIKKENAAGRSLGQWGPSQGVVVMTIEVNEQYASDSPVKHPGRRTELEAHAAALKEIFVGPPKGQTASPSPRAALLGLMAVAPAVGPFGLALTAIALGLTIEQALQQAGATKGQPAGPAGAPAGGSGAQRQIATPLRRLDRWPLGWPAAVGAGTHYTLADGVTLSTDIETKVAEIADDYYAARSKDIVVTSGTRTAASQAEAMYVKLEAGDDILKLYGNNKAAKAVKQAYDDGMAAKQPRAAVVDAMRQVLEGQIAAGVYISKHLKAGAVDVRSRDMTAADKKAFRKAAKGKATKIILETIPPHWHLQF